MRKLIFAKIVMLAIASSLFFSQSSSASEGAQLENTGQNSVKDSQPLPAKENMVNVNTASAKEMMKKLDGIGESKANAIISYREANGGFKKIDDLLKVNGIGKATLDKNRHLISL